MCVGELSHREVQSEAVFTNSELSLKHVDVYGFDFDYTLLQYTPELHKLIYTSACKRLIDKLSVSQQQNSYLATNVYTRRTVPILSVGLRISPYAPSLSIPME